MNKERKTERKSFNNNIYPPSRIYRFPSKKDRPISEIYPMIDTDLARDNLENDIPDADLEDLRV